MRGRAVLWIGYVLCVVTLQFGCGETSRVGKTVPVAGKVTLNGAPLTSGNVTFFPAGSSATQAKGFVPGGSIDSAGMYKLFVEGKEGAPPGSYKVVVNVQPTLDSANPLAKSKSPINPKFTRAEETPLVIEVKEGNSQGAYDLTITD